jgi:hypothetical protein
MTNPVASANKDTGTVDGSGRVRIVTEPALPAICVICRRSANGAIKFIDFQFDMDFYGAVVFCEDCIKECMNLLDLVPRQHFENAEAARDLYMEQLEVAQNELDKYKSLFTSLRDLGLINLDDGNSPKDTNEASGVSESAISGSEQNEPDLDGSDSVGGSEDFSFLED